MAVSPLTVKLNSLFTQKSFNAREIECKEGCQMVTYESLIAYTLMLATIIKIVFDIAKKH